MKLTSKASIIILLIVGFLSHLIWFNFGTILNFSDWSYWPQQATKELIQGWSAWASFFGIGGPNIQISFYAFNLVWSLFALAGSSYDVAVKFTFMIPIAFLGFLSPYFLARRIFEKDELISLCVALFYGSTSYFLARQAAHLPIAFIYAIAPSLFVFVSRVFEEENKYNWVYFALLYSLGTWYELRIMLIVTVMLILYIAFFYLNKIHAHIKELILTMATILGLSMFWLLPSIFGGLSSAIGEVANRGLFGNFLFDLVHAITLYDFSWTGSRPASNFVVQSVKWYFYIAPILVLVPVLSLKKFGANNQRKIIFFLLLSLCGIFLTKQADAPISYAYQWLYDFLPGFNLYREASKFFIISCFGYAFLIGFALLYLKSRPLGEHKTAIFHGTAILIMVLALVNLMPLLNGTYGTLFTARVIPDDYKILTNFLAKDTSFYRTLWVPSPAKWSPYQLLHPRAGLNDFAGSIWSEFLPNYKNAAPATVQINNFLQQPIASQLVASAAIKYVFVPLRDQANDDDFFKFYGDNRLLYIDLLDKVPWLTKVNLGLKDVISYEVKNAKPYISTTTKLVNVEDPQQVNVLYNFSALALGRDFQFTIDPGTTDKTIAPTNVNLLTPFSKLTSTDVKPGQSTSRLPPSELSSLYINNHILHYGYTITPYNLLTLYRDLPLSLTAANKTLDSSQTRTALGELTLNLNKKYLLQQNGQLFPLTSENRNRDLGFLDTPPRIFSESANLVSDPSFEKEQWGNQVSDCNNYDNHADIQSKVVSTTSTDGDKSVQLSAILHTACISSNEMPVEAGSTYEVAFDYKAKEARETQYWVKFNDPAHTVTKVIVSQIDQSWRKYRSLITPPKGATTAQLVLLGESDDRRLTLASTYYDGVYFGKLASELTPQPAAGEQYTQATISSGEKNLSINDNTLTAQNLIPDPSFEQGLWAKTVGDCNAGDGQPDLKMKLNSTSKTNGSYSLELSARRHIACTSTPLLKVNENSNYVFSFNYQSANGGDAAYFLQFNDPAHTIITEHLTPKGTTWQSFQKLVQAPAGSTTALLTVYAYADDYGSHYVTERYDNFQLVRTSGATNRYTFIGQTKAPLTAPRQVIFNAFSPTKKLVTVKGASTPFYLLMAEAYHPNWRLLFNDAAINGPVNSWLPWVHPHEIASLAHFKLNDFENGWYIDTSTYCQQEMRCIKNADGTYDIKFVIEFSSQRWLYLGMIISLTTLGAVLTYIIMRRRSKKEDSSNGR